MAKINDINEMYNDKRKVKYYTKKIINSSAKIGDDEFYTENLQEYLERVIEICNTEGKPALVTLKFPVSKFVKLYDLTLPIFPVAVEKRLKDKDFRLEFFGYATDEKVRDLLQNDIDSKKYDLADETSKAATRMVEVVRRELLEQYLTQKKWQRPNKEILSYIEGLSIMQPLRLDKVSPEQILGPVDISDYFQIPNPTEEDLDKQFDFVENLSKTSQHSPNHPYYLINIDGKLYVAGTRVGRTEKEILANAKFERLASRFQSTIDDRIRLIDRYKRHHIVKLPKSKETTAVGPTNE